MNPAEIAKLELYDSEILYFQAKKAKEAEEEAKKAKEENDVNLKKMYETHQLLIHNRCQEKADEEERLKKEEAEKSKAKVKENVLVMIIISSILFVTSLLVTLTSSNYGSETDNINVYVYKNQNPNSFMDYIYKTVFYMMVLVCLVLGYEENKNKKNADSTVSKNKKKNFRKSGKKFKQ